MVVKKGNNKDNVIDGTASADTLYGRGGNDTLSGLAGADKLYGEAGIDILKGGLGNDRLDGGAGIDRVTYFNDGGTRGVSVDLTSGKATRGTETDTLVSIEDVFGSLYADVIFGNAAANKLSGSNGDDQLFGRAGDDFFSGGAGNDYIDGGAGLRDKVSYESVTTGSGIYADLSYGKIYTYGVDGTDTVVNVEDVDGSNFDDSIYGNGAANTLAGLVGNDYLYGYGSADRLYGVIGNDYLDGGDGDDSLYAGDGDDTLYGGRGNDYLEGYTGIDYLDGGAGSDRLKGGTGVDTFNMYYYEGMGTGRDTIEDFVKGEDKVSLNIYSDYATVDDFWDLDSNYNGVLDDADYLVRVEKVAYNGISKVSTVIDLSGVTTEAGELSLVVFGTTGLTWVDFA